MAQFPWLFTLASLLPTFTGQAPALGLWVVGEVGGHLPLPASPSLLGSLWVAPLDSFSFLRSFFPRFLYFLPLRAFASTLGYGVFVGWLGGTFCISNSRKCSCSSPSTSRSLPSGCSLPSFASSTFLHWSFLAGPPCMRNPVDSHSTSMSLYNSS